MDNVVAVKNFQSSYKVQTVLYDLLQAEVLIAFLSLLNQLI
jgi:hypothetical protein